MAEKITFGKVPFPEFIDHQASTAGKPEGIGWNNLGKRTPMFVVLHRMIGTLHSTDSFFPQRDTGALTDYGLGTANVDGAASDGKIIQWNDPRGYRAGWASGPVSAPYGDALRWINWSGNKWGVSICNVCGVSIEHSGNYNDPITDFAMGEDAKFLAYWFDQFGIAWDKAPIHPITGISAVTWHQEWTIGTGKICPGPWLMDHTDSLIDAASVIMKKYQTSSGTVPPVPPVDPPTPTYKTPVPPAFFDELKDKNYKADGDTFWFKDNATYTVTNDTNQLLYAVSGSGLVGPKLKKNDTVKAIAKGQSKTDKKFYIIAENLARVNLDDLTLK